MLLLCNYFRIISRRQINSDIAAAAAAAAADDDDDNPGEKMT